MVNNVASLKQGKQIIDLLLSLNHDQAQQWIENGDLLKLIPAAINLKDIDRQWLIDLLEGKNDLKKFGRILAEWRHFWSHYGIKADFSGIRIPDPREEFDRLLVIPEGLTEGRMIDIFRKSFSVNNRLGLVGIENDRVAEKSYAIWVRNRQNADEELSGLSADDLKEKGLKGITLLERLVYELKYFKETKQHLDAESFWTLCSGSRGHNGFVAGVYWMQAGAFVIQNLSPSSAEDKLCGREVVA